MVQPGVLDPSQRQNTTQNAPRAAVDAEHQALVSLRKITLSSAEHAANAMAPYQKAHQLQVLSPSPLFSSASLGIGFPCTRLRDPALKILSVQQVSRGCKDLNLRNQVGESASEVQSIIECSKLRLRLCPLIKELVDGCGDVAEVIRVHVFTKSSLCRLHQLAEEELRKTGLTQNKVSTKTCEYTNASRHQT